MMTSSTPAISGPMTMREIMSVIFSEPPRGPVTINLKSNPGDPNVHTGGGAAPKVVAFGQNIHHCQNFFTVAILWKWNDTTKYDIKILRNSKIKQRTKKKLRCKLRHRQAFRAIIQFQLLAGTHKNILTLTLRHFAYSKDFFNPENGYSKKRGIYYIIFQRAPTASVTPPGFSLQIRMIEIWENETETESMQFNSIKVAKSSFVTLFGIKHRFQAHFSHYSS